MSFNFWVKLSLRVEVDFSAAAEEELAEGRAAAEEELAEGRTITPPPTMTECADASDMVG